LGQQPAGPSGEEFRELGHFGERSKRDQVKGGEEELAVSMVMRPLGRWFAVTGPAVGG
jgi:hypothetical protein